MEKDDVLKALSDFLNGNSLPYLSDSHKIGIACLHSDSWVTGGVSGGSCWDEGDDDPHYERDSESPETITLLEKFLEEFYPHLSLSQYKDLTNHIQSDDWGVNEYYGNYTNYKCLYITFEDIADYFVHMKKPKLVMG